MGDCCCVVCVQTSEIGVVERFGRFSHAAGPGPHCLLWPIFSMSSRLTVRLQSLNVECETKTKDNVFVNVIVEVQFQVLRGDVKSAAYKLTNPAQQIRAYVFDVVRSTVPRMDLDEVFESKETVALSVKEQLNAAMSEYGYTIIQTLVTDLSPATVVRDAMNKINTAARVKDATLDKAEAEKTFVVKAAEADAEGKYLLGVGVAKQRKAIIDGLRESVYDFAEESGTNPHEIIHLLMITQFFDMLETIGAKSSNPSLFLNHSPSAVLDLQETIHGGLDMKR